MTGIDALRAMAMARVKQQTYGRIANEIGVSPDTLRDFAEGRRATLPDEKLRALAKQIYEGHAEYDAETGMLRPVNRTTRPLGEPATVKCIAPKTFGLGPGYDSGTIKPVEAAPKPKRARWIGALFGA
jgi:hypothetical protein